MRPSDESHLIRLARSGDRAAMSELYRRHVDRIYQYVRYRVGDDILAEDITADVFVRALEGLEQYADRGAPLAAWLYRIASARVIDHWRAVRRRQTSPLEEDGQEDLVSDEETDRGDVLQDESLRKAIQGLTDDQQSVIVLRFFQGLGTAEIAQVLGKTEGAVKALQRRALEALARRLESE